MGQAGRNLWGVPDQRQAVLHRRAIRTGKWKDRDGNERKSYDIVARYMQMRSPSANGNGAEPNKAKPAQVSQSSEEDNPFRDDEAGEQIPF